MIEVRMPAKTRLAVDIEQFYEAVTTISPEYFQPGERNKFNTLTKKLQQLHWLIKNHSPATLDLNHIIYELIIIKIYYNEQLDGTILTEREFDETVNKLLATAQAIQANAI